MRKRRFYLLWICLTAVMALAGDMGVMAETPRAGTPSLLEQFSEKRAQDADTKTLSSPSTNLTALIKDPALLEQLELAVLRYQIAAMEHRRAALEWQHTSSIVIFWVVLLVVLSGLVFSGMQFWASRTSRGMAQTPSVPVGENASGQTEVEVSLSGIKVSSSVIGILILTISLVFFYLYLVYVYKISEIHAVALG